MATCLAAALLSTGVKPVHAARTCGGLRATVTGSSKSDFLAGTPGADVISTGPGHDQVYGRGGNDVICAGRGDDLVVGGPGDDLLLGERGVDDMFGEDGNDRLKTGDGPTNTASGGPGDDRLTGGEGLDLSNYLEFGSPIEADLTDGRATGEGTDTFASIEGVLGSRADDTLRGNGDGNLLVGAGGNDLISGGGNSAGLVTPHGPDADILVGDGDPLLPPGADVLEGGTGINIADYTSAQQAMTVDLTDGTAVGDGADRLIEIQGVAGSEFDDTLTGNEDDNAFRGYQGSDIISGNAGEDVVVFTTAREGVTVDLELGSATGEGSDSLVGIEGIWGSYASDRLAGSAAANWIFGLRGADRITGSDGDDLLHGGPGDDALDGGPGTDRCRAGEANTLCENDEPPPDAPTERCGDTQRSARNACSSRAPELPRLYLSTRVSIRSSFKVPPPSMRTSASSTRRTTVLIARR